MDVTALEMLNILIKRDNVNYTDIAKNMNTTPQNIAQTFKKSNISIEKLQKLARAAGYELKIDFEKIEK